MLFFKQILLFLVTIVSVYGTSDHQRHQRRQQQQTDTSNYRIGTGVADITGPVAEVMMMGYAQVKYGHTFLSCSLCFTTLFFPQWKADENN
ncbi:hypothetical protein BDC45DRAFT_211617 [Circinella umbellata]|nr:hypothetical protein BDC45DRAFT_211617 [Circinella umbellata]